MIVTEKRKGNNIAAIWVHLSVVKKSLDGKWWVIGECNHATFDARGPFDTEKEAKETIPRTEIRIFDMHTGKTTK